MGLDAPIHVDGVQVGVFRFGEMPAIPPIELEGGSRRYRLYDYLKSIGVAPETIKSIHFHGNSDRIASVEGSELRKEKDRFQFSFTSGDTGAPLQRWGTTHLKNEFVVHEIRRMTVYVKKPTPAIHPQRQCHVDANGECTEAIPYATGEVAKGTRIYLDGKMVGFVKRRQVTDAMVVAAADDVSENKYSLAKLVAGMGVDPTSLKAAEFVAGDDVVGRASGTEFVQLAQQTYFTLPKHSHGKVRIHVPAELQARTQDATDKDALVSSILLYRSGSPMTRDLVAISEDTDLSVRLATADQPGKLGPGGALGEH